MHRYKYLAVDPNVLRILAFVDLLAQEHEYIDVDKIKNDQLRKDFNYYKRLYDCIVTDHIRIVLLEHVYRVSKHSETLMNFIKKYCYCSNYNSKNYEEKTNKMLELSKAYCCEYVLRDEIHPAPINLNGLSTHQKEYQMKNALMMAQATIEGCMFLTTHENLIINKRSSQNNRENAVGIFNINMLNGYYDTMFNGKMLSPHPILLRDIGPMTKDPNTFVTPNLSKGILPADLIL